MFQSYLRLGDFNRRRFSGDGTNHHKAKSRLLGLCIALTTLTVFLCAGLVRAHSLETNYVPWGVDEYELFGLTEKELTKKFDGMLTFKDHFTRATFNGQDRAGWGQPQFRLTFENGKVIGAKRLFIDGAGCHIWGPDLSSKEEAVRFSIDGLSSLENRDHDDRQRLDKARRAMMLIDGAKSAKSPPISSKALK